VGDEPKPEFAALLDSRIPYVYAVVATLLVIAITWEMAVKPAI